MVFNVDGDERTQIDDLGIDAGVFRRGLGNVHHGAVGEHGDVAPLTHHGGFAERDRVIALRHFACGMFRPRLHRPIAAAIERTVVNALGFEEDDRIVVLDGGDEQPLRVIRCGRRHRFQAGDMREQRFGALAVCLAAENATAIGHAHHHRHRVVAGRAITDARGFRDQLVVGGINIVGKLDFDDGPQAVRGHANGGAGDAAFVDRRVEAAGHAVLFLQAFSDAKHAAEIADVFAERQHVRIAAHHHVER